MGETTVAMWVNVQSIPEHDAGIFGQHENSSYNTELNFILDILEHNTSKSKLYDEIKAGYKNYDNNRTNNTSKSKVTHSMYHTPKGGGLR